MSGLTLSWRILGWIAGGLLLILSLGLLGQRLPRPALSQHYPQSTVITASNGELLRLTLAADQQYRVWVPLAQIPQALRIATLLYEDHWFYHHFGINPIALLRSVWMTYVRGNQQGASTISMQVARKLYRLHTRTVWGKIQQISAALWLELRYSKAALLEIYLNSAPYGGNITGAAAASLLYFHKPVSQLTLIEALTLAVIPQNPVRRFPNRHPWPKTLAPELLSARQRLWQIWQQHYPRDTSRYAADFALPLRVYSKAQKPFIAPHLTYYLLQHYPGVTILHSSIDIKVQSSFKRSLDAYVRQHYQTGLRNAAVLLADTRTMQVKALLGSADFWNSGIQGQINGALAKRSPGSTLKPFIYALALDQGLIHPQTILADTPTTLGSYNPENFDNRFLGPLTAQDALIRSRNIPAVKVMAQLKQPTLHHFLTQAGVGQLASEEHYGLSLALGAGDITMVELAQLYALLRNQGEWQALRWLATDTRNTLPGTQLLSPAAAYITLEMLSHNPRPDNKQPAQPWVAWKTGTSWGFKDAWAVGIVGHYVLVVWTGNFNNQGNSAFIGLQTAAPLFFALVDSLRAQRLLSGLEVTLPPVPNTLSAVEVCTASGELPNADCPARIKTWFIPGKSPIKISTLHRAVYFDYQGNVRCPQQPYYRREVYEFWPEALATLFAQAGMPRRTPPKLPSCYNQLPGGSLDLVSPTLGGVYTLRRSKPASIALKVNSPQPTDIYWFANKSYLGKTDSSNTLFWQPTAPQSYLLRAIDAQGHSASREIKVNFIP